jgi:carbon storage regulator
MVSGPQGDCLVTVLQVQGNEVFLLISLTAADKPGVMDAWTAHAGKDATVRVGRTVEVVLVDVLGEKARIGIRAPKEASVHRLEVWQAIRRENRRADGSEEDGPAGSRVPRPTGPKPPPLDVRLDEPPPADGGGE